MQFKVSWETTSRCELVIEATSKEEAEDLVLTGQFNADEVEEDIEFNGVTLVEEIA